MSRHFSTHSTHSDSLLNTKAAIKFSFCVVARYLTEKRRFEQQNPVKIKCSQLNCDQPQKEDLIASLVRIENTLQTQIISSSCISAPNTFNKSAAVPKFPTDTHFKYYVDIAYETFLNISCTICVTKSVSDIGRFETFY